MQVEAERTKRKIEHNIKMREMERQNLQELVQYSQEIYKSNA